MGYTKTVGEYLSSDGKSSIKYFVFTPDETPFAVLQISHGGFEHIGRYESNGFVEAMTDSGIVVCGNDFIGHGESAGTESEAGHFENHRNIIDDLHTLNGIMRKTYRSLPYILYGFDIGGLAARVYSAEYDDIDGAVFVGTPSGSSSHGLFSAFLKLTLTFRGGKHKSKSLDRLALSGLNGAFAEERDCLSFLTSDSEARDRLRTDPGCVFSHTAAAYCGILKLLSEASDGERIQNFPLSLPVLLASGSLDPVSDNGEGTKEIFAQLEDIELNELKIKIYNGCRHDLITEKCRDGYYADLIEWIKEVSDGVVACRSYNTLPFGNI